MSTKLFQHSRMTRIAAVLFLLAGAVGLPTVMLLPDAGFRTVLRAQLAAGGVGERQAQNTWLALYGLVSVLCVAVPLIVAAGIGDSLRGHPARGLGRLSTLAQWAETAVNVAGAGLAVLFIYRFVRYAVLTLPENGGVYAFFAMAVMEGIMASLAAFLFFQLRKFLNALSDGTASMAYSFATGKLDDRAIPGRMASGFSWLAVGCLLLAARRLVTLTIVQDYVQSYYKIELAAHPGQLFAAASLMLCAGADVLLAVYLRRYKRHCEWALHLQRKEKSPERGEPLR